MVVPSVPLKDLFAVLRHHARLILLITALTMLPVVWWVYLRPPTYEARALVRLADVRRAIAGGIESDPDAQPIGKFTDELLSQVQVLQGRTVLGDVVDREGLRLVSADTKLPSRYLAGVRVADSAAPDTFTLRFVGDGAVVERGGREMEVPVGSPVDLGDIQLTIAASAPAGHEETLEVRTKETAVDWVIEGLSAAPRTGTDVIDVTFTSRDSVLSQRVVNSIVNAFRDYDLRVAQEISTRRVEFLEEQLRQVDSIHTAAQQELSAFRAESQFFFSEGRIGDQQQTLEDLDKRWEELAADRRMFSDLLSTATSAQGEEQERAFRTLLATPEIASNGAIQQLYTQLIQYQAQREELTAGPLGSTSQDPEVRRLESLITSTRAKLLDAARSHLASISAQLASVDELRARSRARAQPLPVLAATEERLLERVNSAGRALEQLRADLREASMAQAVEAGRVQIIDYAPGSEPTGSNGPLKLAIGLVLGLFLGAGGAFVAESSNTAIRRPQDVAGVLGVPQLGVVPRIEINGDRGLRRLTSAITEGSRRTAFGGTGNINAEAVRKAAEAYRTLRSNLIFTARNSSIQTLVVTSASPAEGKTTTAANLAASFAHQGFNILLIDADLRNPRLHRVLSTDQEPGLAEVLTGERELEDVVRITSCPGLRLIPAGARTLNAAELLGLPSLRDILVELGNSYDLVVVDSPPVLAATDAAILAAQTDAVLMVVRAGTTERQAAEEAMQQLAFAGGHVVGAVLNDPDAELPRYGVYYPRYSYGNAAQLG